MVIKVLDSRIFHATRIGKIGIINYRWNFDPTYCLIKGEDDL